MANYTATQLLAARFKFNEKFKKPEMRPKPSAVNDVLLKNMDMLAPAFNSIKNSDSRTKSTMILNNATATGASARAHNHTGAVGDSTLANLTWVTKARQFEVSLKMGDRNEFDYDEIFANRLLSSIQLLHQDIETYNVAWMNTNKSQVVKNLTPKNVDWDAAAFIAQVKLGDKDYFAQYAKSFMKQQWHTGALDFIGDSAVHAILEQQSNQGVGNSTNLGFQFAGINWGESIDDLSFGADYMGGGYIFPIDSVGLLQWIPLENRQNKTTKLYDYSYIDDPLGSGLVFAVHRYEAGADTSATYGETQDVKFYYEISIDFCPIAADISTANEYPIFKVGLLAT